MRIVCLALGAGLTILSACKDEPRYAASSESDAIDRGRLCSDGGATLDQATNECVCGNGQTWTGIHCEATATVTPPPAGPTLPEGLPPHDIESDAVAHAESEPPPASPVAETAASDATARLKGACQRAKGLWIEKDSYCHCTGDRVLVGRRCRTLNGSVTDDTCLRAVNKGRWTKGTCACEPGLVFSPSRGGCVAKFAGDEVFLRRICESSLNKGKWDAIHDLCKCPVGRVWSDELCLVQANLSSKAVCESAANRGSWQVGSKSCACPEGFFWIHQACQRLAGVGDKEACEGETNRGLWDEGRLVCICPGLRRWNGAKKACG